MSNIYLGISVVFPIFCMMALGYFLKYKNILNENFFDQLSLMSYKIFLPFVLFMNIYHSDFYTLFDVKYIGLSVAIVVASFCLLCFIIPKIEKKNMNRSVMIQGIFRSNSILFCIPIVQNIYGYESTGITAIMLAFVVPLFNVFAVFILSKYSKSNPSPKEVLLDVVRNPLIIGSVLGFLFAIFKIPMPSLLDEVMNELAKSATPISLIALGGCFQFSSLSLYKKQLTVSVLGKLVILPLIFIPIAILLGYRNIELASLMGMLLSPTSVSSFTMAQSAKANAQLAGQIVVLTSLFSVVTIFPWIVVLKQMGLI